MTLLRDRYGITDFPERVISQWQGSNLQKLVEEMTMQFENDLFKQLEYLERQTDIDTADGIWLDFIGFKVGFPRPLTDAANIPQFGFEDADGDPASDPRSLGFDQAPLDTIQEHLVDRAPFGDDLYRKFIKLRLVLLLGNMSIPHIQTAVRQVAPNASVEEREPSAIRINLKGVNRITEGEFKKEPVRSWVKPAGVSLSIYNIPDAIWLLDNTLENTATNTDRRQDIFYISFSNNPFNDRNADGELTPLIPVPTNNAERAGINDTGVITINEGKNGNYEGLAVDHSGIYVIDRGGQRIIRYPNTINSTIAEEKAIPTGFWLGLAIEDGVIYALDRRYDTTNDRYQRIVRFNSWDDVSATVTSDQIKDIPRTYTESGTTNSIEWSGIGVNNGAIYIMNGSQGSIARFDSWNNVSDDISDATVASHNIHAAQVLAVNNEKVYVLIDGSSLMHRYDKFGDIRQTRPPEPPNLVTGRRRLRDLAGILNSVRNYHWCGLDVTGDV